MTERELYLARRDDEQVNQSAAQEERGETRQGSQPAERFVDKRSALTSSGGVVSRGYKLMFFDLDEA